MSKQTNEVLQIAAGWIGIQCGILPFVFKIFGHGGSWITLPLYLPDPYSLVVAGLVLVFAVAVIIWLDALKKRA
ncbi:putative membrane protein [Kutzneria albida DSM 43870]|nr:putative membrane protein [Kutzneria albida DSM 43870]